jgi:hypothetical protein
VPYQSTHNTGGTMMGADPKSSVVNRTGRPGTRTICSCWARRSSATARLQPDRQARLLGGRGDRPNVKSPGPLVHA